MKQVYLENDLVYKVSDDMRFTGLVQLKRRNGHLVYDEEYKDGVILSSNSYFNGKGQRLANRTVYNRYKLWVLSKEYMYDLKGNRIGIIKYNEEGVKILEEEFEGDEVTYSCQYLGKKKHGVEICYSDEGEKLTFEYSNGKKQKAPKRKPKD